MATHWFACAAAEKYPSVTVDADRCTWWTARRGPPRARVPASTWHSQWSAVTSATAWLVRLPRGWWSMRAVRLPVAIQPAAIGSSQGRWSVRRVDRLAAGQSASSVGCPETCRALGLSERTFYRKFVAATGDSPARFHRGVRLDAARMLLSQGLTLKAIAAQVGLTPTARFTRAFERRFGVSPSLFREMHPNAS